MKVIIVDDEPRAIGLLKDYLVHFSQVELVGTFRNGLKAAAYCNENKVDLIFLDINMPHLSGIALSRMLPKDIMIVFTTAYSEYAVESYELEVVDYLLKPISIERFSRTMLKITNSIKEDTPETKKHILIKSGSRIYQVLPSDILYLAKDGNYMTYYLGTQKIIARESVAEAMEALPEYFVQIHKSYIVNRDKIVYIDKDMVSVSGQNLPIGNAFRESFQKYLS
ncbi:MAG: LytTR family DNA-binding domain-containing protein [Bacteroidia bacterium]